MRRNALVVEDEPLIMQGLTMFLDELGFEAVMADSGIKAVELASHQDLAFALLDWNVPGGAITPVAEILKRRGIPFAYMTGGLGLEQLDGAGVPVLYKPFKLADVEGFIKQSGLLD
jgi:DNA-binding response OmpR family regulator